MPGRPTSSTPIKFVALCVLALALFGVLWAGQLFRADLQFTAVATEVGFWGRGEYKPFEATISRTNIELDQLVKSRPKNPEYLLLQANVLVWQSFWATEPAVRERHVTEAIAAQSLALQSRPAHRQSWLKLIEYAARSKDGGEVEARAQQQLAALQRWDQPPQTLQ